MHRTALSLTAFLLSLALLTPASAQSSLYFLSVGSSRYLAPSDPRDHGFQDLIGARNGARMVAERLADWGARFGIVLSSSEGKIVSLKDFDEAVEAVLAQIGNDKTADPLLIVYIAAHGISDGFAWNHFSVPGDMTYRGEPERLAADLLPRFTIHAASLVDRLNRQKVRYVLVLDTCYEGEAAKFDSPVLSPRASSNIGAIAEGLRRLNEFEQPSPVLFSTEPGSRVEVAPDPTDPEHNSTGPLARRLLLLLDDNKTKHRPLTVEAMVTWLSSPNADKATRPAVTRATPAPWWKAPIGGGGTAARVEERYGTASEPRLCCLGQEAAATSEPEAMTGRILLVGGLGEYVSDGRTILLKSKISMERPSERTISLHASSEDGDWDLDFSSPSPLAVGRYDNAARAGFEDNAPGLSVSGEGRACNEVKGEFEIVSLPPADRALFIRFTQLCEGDEPPLRGEVVLEPR